MQAPGSGWKGLAAAGSAEEELADSEVAERDWDVE